MSAGKLSKIENRRVRPTVQDVELVLSALGISTEAREQFLEAARAEATEATAWRLLRRIGPWKHQQAIQAIEANTEALKLFQGQLIPGLLQIPEYITAIFNLPPGLPEESRTKTVSSRVHRQSALHAPDRSFHFLICEHVLRWQICEPSVMALQLDRLVSVSRLPNVTLGVVPEGRRMPDFPMTCFSLHDDRLVMIETFHSEITTREPRDIQTYSETFDRFSKVALYGDEMRNVIEGARDSFLPQQESS